MNVVTAMKSRSGAVLALSVMTAAGGIAGASGASAAPAPAAAHASASPACTGATTYAGKTMPGYRGRRTPCYIAYGSRGYQVTVLQRFLNGSAAAGQRVAVDGVYGPATRQKVRAYQHQWNGYPCSKSWTIKNIDLVVDGLWGPQTSKVSQNQLEYCGD